MVFHVEIDPDAVSEIEEIYDWIRKQAPARATSWFNRLYSSIESLQMMPERCPIAPESAVFKLEIRQLMYGKRGGRYRIIFTISGETVRVLRVRHAAMHRARPGA